jgi:hypothetical protein
MQDASSLAEQVQQERLKPGKQPELHALEAELARTWNAIRLARSPGAAVSDELRRRPKWG